MWGKSTREKRLWGKMSLGEKVVGKNVTWGKMSLGKNVLGTIVMGKNVAGKNGIWGKMLQSLSRGILSILTSFVSLQRKGFKGVYMNGVLGLGVWPKYNMEKIAKNPKYHESFCP